MKRFNFDKDTVYMVILFLIAIVVGVIVIYTGRIKFTPLGALVAILVSILAMYIIFDILKKMEKK